MKFLGRIIIVIFLSPVVALAVPHPHEDVVVTGSFEAQGSVTGIDNDDVGLGNVQNVDQTNADNISSGTVADARVAGSIARVSQIPANTSDLNNDSGFITGYTETDPVFSAHPATAVTSAGIASWNTAFSWGNHSLAGYLTSYTESDPVFSAHPAAAVTSAGIANWNTAFSWGNHSLAGYLTSYTEGDPVFSAHPAAAVTSGGITNWNTAFSWGNHSLAGYLTSYTESDPVFSAHPATAVTSAGIANWNTAFSWGNHSLAGYLTSYTESDPVFTAWDKDYGDLINRPTTISGAESAAITANTTKLSTIEDEAKDDQDLFATITGNSGTVTAATPITTINIVGATGVTTAVSGSTLTITVNAYLTGALVRPGRAGGQTAYGGTGAGDDLVLYSTTSSTKGSVFVGSSGSSGVEIDEATGETVITGTLIIK